MVVQQRQHMDAVGGCTIFMSVCNILRICSAEIQICNSSSVSTYNSPGYRSAVNSKKWQEKKTFIKQKALKLSSV